MSTGERGQRGDHGQQGDRGEIGVQGERGLTGQPGAQGRRGERGEPPGGVLRLTDRRLLVLYVFLVIALALVVYRTETNANTIRQHNYENCVAIATLASAFNAENPDHETPVPNCQRLKP